MQHIVHLGGGGAHFHRGIDQPGGPHHLLDDLAGVLLFVVSRCGRDKNGLAHTALKFFKFERAVVQRRGQAKAVLNECGFARAVAVVHGRELANHLVALVEEHQRIGRQVVGECAGRLARLGS